MSYGLEMSLSFDLFDVVVATRSYWMKCLHGILMNDIACGLYLSAILFFENVGVYRRVWLNINTFT